MPNTRVVGLVVAEGDEAPLAGLTVAALDKDGLFGDDLLDMAETDAAGRFQIDYPPGAYGLEANPDIVVHLYDRAKRLLFKSAVFEDVTATELTVPTIKVRRDSVFGLAVTLGGSTAPFKSSGNDVQFLVDNDEAWSQLAASIRGAQNSIHLSQLHMDVIAQDGSPEEEGPRGFLSFLTTVPQAVGVQIEHALVEASQRNVIVRVLLNDFRLFYGIPVLGIDFPAYPLDTSGRLSAYLDSLGAAANRVQYRRFRMPMVTPMHAKLVIIDGVEAFTIGSPFIQEYFDDSQHRFQNPKRGWHHVIDAMKVPIHDVSSVVRGPVVAHIDEAFCLHWNQERAGRPVVPHATTPGADPAGVQIQVVRSLRGEERFGEVPQGEAGIFESYLRAIANAEHFIYIEDQYFTCEELADALVLAIQHKPDLELILVLNNQVDIPPYGTWQRRFFRRLLRYITDAERARVGLYTLWTHELQPFPLLIRNYIHSKVAIVDDRWATVGSANCDSVSLTASQHVTLLNAIALGIPSVVNALMGDEFDFRNQRNSEVNLAFFNDDGSAHLAVETMRRRLWAEHLGFVDAQGKPDASNPALALPFDGKVLKTWIDKAESKRLGLKSNPSVVQSARILKYPHVKGVLPEDLDDAKAYLRHLEADLTRLTVLSQVQSFSFHNGQWLD